MNTNFICSGVLAAVLVGALGCSEALQQDPLASQPDYIREAQPIERKPAPDEPLSSDAVRADAPDLMLFKEGEPNKFEVRARFLLKNYKDYQGRIVISNLKDFPGAQFDAATGVLAWTPPKGFITAGGLSQEYTMEVMALAEPLTEGEPVLMGRKIVRIVVSKEMGVPEILSVKTSASQIREGERISIRVKIKDQDGGVSPDMYPRLEVLAVAFRSSLAPFIKLTTVVMDFPSRTWEYVLSLELEDVSFTDSATDGIVHLRAVSPYGRASATTELKIRVLTQISKPETTWQQAVRLKPGVEGRIPFLIYDPQFEARVRIAPQTRLPVGGKLNCVAESNDAMQSCEFVWTPPYNAKEQRTELQVTATSSNKDFNDRVTAQSNFRLPVIVEAGVKPPQVLGQSNRGGF